MKYKTIGILGGMGPAATADLYNKIISIFQKGYNAKYDADFPEIVIISLPIPDIVENIENESITVTMLCNTAQRLEKAGADFIAIPCNTAHVYLKQIQEAVVIPILSIMEETALVCKEQNFVNVGLISTRFTRDKKLFDTELESIGINTITLNDARQTIATKIVMEILQGNLTQSNKDKLIDLLQNLKNKQAEAVILGCTEFPLLIKQTDVPLPLIDTTQILAEACVREAIKYENVYKEV